jgi:hypothetical protein
MQCSHVKPERPRESSLREAKSPTQFGDVHSVGHHDSIVRQFNLAARMGERFVETGEEPTA